MWAFRETHRKRRREFDMDEAVAEIEAERDGTPAEDVRKQRPAITEKILREEVSLDLDRLMNTIALESSLPELAEFAEARRSIINFGLPDFVHRTMDELASNDGGFEREIVSALETYEPRLVPGTIRTRRIVTDDAVDQKVRFHVFADLTCRPVNVQIQFTADIEVDTGKVQVSRI